MILKIACLKKKTKNTKCYNRIHDGQTTKRNYKEKHITQTKQLDLYSVNLTFQIGILCITEI